MARNLRGKVLVGSLALVLCAKAATSFPRGPLEIDPIETTPHAQHVVKAASESPGVSIGTDPAVPTSEESVDVSHTNQCEAPEDLLNALSAERLLITQQKKDLDDRKAEIALAREKLEIEKVALMELKNSIEDLLSRIDAQKSEDLERLIALYQNMKPAEAAAIMNDIDIEVMIMVLGAMPPRVAAPILARMSPVRAGAVSKIIFERSKLPGDQNLNGIQFN